MRSMQTGAEERKELSGGSVNQGTLMYSQENELRFLSAFLGYLYIIVHKCYLSVYRSPWNVEEGFVR